MTSKLSARDRLSLLLDPGTFHESSCTPDIPAAAAPAPAVPSVTAPSAVDSAASAPAATAMSAAPTPGVITGWGLVNRRKVFVYAQDFSVSGGALGKAQAYAICRVLAAAREAKAPVVGINDSAGAKIQEGVDALSGCGSMFHQHVLCSGKIPQITLIMGPCAGAAAYAPSLTDLVLMTEGSSRMFCTGPAVVSSVTYEEVEAEILGGAATHAAITGIADLTAADDRALLLKARRLLSYLPSSSEEMPPEAQETLLQSNTPVNHVTTSPSTTSTASSSTTSATSSSTTSAASPSTTCTVSSPPQAANALATLLPDNPKIPYDMKELIRLIADPDSFFELQPLFADNLVTALIRIAGRVTGVIANQPMEMAGCLDTLAAKKGAKFVRLCSRFHIPLLSLMDTPGFLPGVEEEHGGILQQGAGLLTALNTAQVPLVTVIIRKAYGGAYIAMGSRECGADLVLAWPTAEIGVMGAEGAVSILYRKEIASAKDPDQERKRLAEEYRSSYSSSSQAVERGYVDRIIRPEETRSELIHAFSQLLQQ